MKHETPGYSGGETLFGAEIQAPNASILDFWQWAYSDLTDNVNRGVFAEWMVAKLLGVRFEATRIPWDAFDLVTEEGIRVEVKTSAYVHAWTERESAVAPRGPARFTGLCARLWTDADQAKVADEATFNADVYVFCLQAHEDPKTWDALNLDQWEFYVLSRQRVERNGCQSMGIGTLRSLAARVSPASLRKAVLAAHTEQGEERNAATH